MCSCSLFCNLHVLNPIIHCNFYFPHTVIAHQRDSKSEKKKKPLLIIFGTLYSSVQASLVVQRLKHLPAMWETWVRSLGREDSLEEEMATHSSILAWRIPWMKELGGLQSTGCKESDTTERLHFTSFLCTNFYLPIYLLSQEFTLIFFVMQVYW